MSRQTKHLPGRYVGASRPPPQSLVEEAGLAPYQSATVALAAASLLLCASATAAIPVSLPVVGVALSVCGAALLVTAVAFGAFDRFLP